MASLTTNGLISQVGYATADFLSAVKSLISFTGAVTAGLFDAVKHPQKVRWKDMFFCMNRCGTDGVPVILLICFLTGVILAYQSAVQMHKYGADAFLPALVGCTIVRELGPLMTAVMVTGRSGASFAAEIGSMKVSEELDALTTMGLSPIRFLVIPKLLAMLCVVPMLTVIGDFVGILGGLVIGGTELHMSGTTYLQITKSWVAPKYFFEGILKSYVFAWLITVSGCWCGMETGNDAIAVGNSTTRSVVTSILLIVFCDALLAKVFAVVYSLGV